MSYGCLRASGPHHEVFFRYYKIIIGIIILTVYVANTIQIISLSPSFMPLGFLGTKLNFYISSQK